MRISLKENIKISEIHNKMDCSDSLGSWLSKVKNPNLFWYHYNEIDPPLNINNPEINIEIGYLKERPDWKIRKVVIETQTGNKILFEGTMVNGVLKGHVDSKLVNHPAWKSRLVIGKKCVRE